MTREIFHRFPLSFFVEIFCESGNMIEPFEYQGKWFLPDDPSIKIAGILKFNPREDTRLELIGAFDKIPDKIEIMLGVLPSGDQVTLLNSFELRRKQSSGGFVIATYICNFVILGAHFSKVSQIKFNQLSISFSHLDEWLNLSDSFKFDQDLRNHRISIEYQLPQPITVKLESNLELTINTTAEGPSKNFVQKEALIRQKSYVVFKSRRKIPLEQALKYASHFQNFLTLAIQRGIYPKEFFAFLKSQNGSTLIRTQLFYHLTQIPKYEKELIPIDMLVPFKELSSKFDKVIKSWYQLMEPSKVFLDPYFSTFNAPFSYVSDRFLNIAKAIEAFHRDTIRKKEPSGGDVTFKKRLIEVFRKYSKSYNSILKIRSKQELAEKIKTHRNDLTHSNPVLKSLRKRHLDLYNLSEKISLIMACTILAQHHFSLSEIKHLVEKSNLFNHYKYKDS